VGHTTQLAADRRVDMWVIMSVDICPDGRIPIDVFAAASAIAEQCTPAFDQNHCLVFRSAPFAHVRKRVPNEALVPINQLFRIPLSHKRAVIC